MSLIRKINIANGLYWVEIPDADFRLLCGCPADSVKHLIRRGLILSTERDGVTFETGPNAILFSEIPIQNGAFANLGEFPVLQMLYRQGMILPNHPNNTGRKPLLIGRRDEIESQLHYIYRGNYGLISPEEMIAAGATAEEADRMMRIKRRFAFGHIRHPRELLDTLILGREETEIRDGVRIKRSGLNRYEISYQGESASIDLNLGERRHYESAYPLGTYQFKRDFFAVIHAGEGDGWDINRPTMSSLLVYQGRVYLIDAGPNLDLTLQSLGVGINEIEGIFHTHCHDDHFAGLTSLIRADRRIAYYATPLVRASVARKLAALLSVENSFLEQFFDVHDLKPGEWNDIEGLEVKPVPSPHPVETTAFLFRSLWEGGTRTYAHLADIASLDLLRSWTTDPNDPDHLPPDWVEEVARAYAEPADVKKIDIGGGMIHGMAKDFKDDSSGRIILSHIARPLTDIERTIGSGARFGAVEVLIPGNTDFGRRTAYEYLAAYLPNLPHHQLRLLLNNPIVTINPETVFVREGEPQKEIFLLLSGTAERISARLGSVTMLSSGAMIGEVSGLENGPALGTYRAISYIQALRMPCDLYRTLTERHNLTAEILRTRGKHIFLQQTWLFGENVSSVTLSKIGRQAESIPLKAGDRIDPGAEDCLLFVETGAIERHMDNELRETLKPGDFFGEEAAIVGTPSLFDFQAAVDSAILRIPGSALRDIPVVRFKILETYSRRTREAVELDTDETTSLRWHAAFSVNIEEIDLQHRKLFDAANAILHAMAEKSVPHDLNKLFHCLTECAERHFADEEALIARYAYNNSTAHRAKHAHLLERLRELQRRIVANHAQATLEETASFLKDWIVQHILTEDRRYAHFLNQKGVY